MNTLTKRVVAASLFVIGWTVLYGELGDELRVILRAYTGVGACIAGGVMFFSSLGKKETP